MPDPRRLELLLVTRNLPPLRGGMERLNAEIVAALSPEYAVSVCGPRGCGNALSLDASRVREAPHRPLAAFLLAALVGTISLVVRQRPRMIFAGSGLTAPIAWFAARCSGARYFVYLHGLDVIAASKVYQRLWLPFIRRADHVIVNSRNTRRLAAERDIHGGRIQILHPGVKIAPLDDRARGRFRHQLGLDESPLLLSVGRLTPRKGLPEFIAKAFPAILEKWPSAKLLIIGDDAKDAVHAASESERARIEIAARDARVLDSVKFLPPCDDETLSDAYCAADVYIFPVREVPGDVEGFGMVAIEAAAHGLPTVAFDVGGIADAVDAGSSGYLVPARDYAQFARKVLDILDAPQAAPLRDAARAFARDFSWDLFGERLRKIVAAT